MKTLRLIWREPCYNNHLGRQGVQGVSTRWWRLGLRLYLEINSQLQQYHNYTLFSLVKEKCLCLQKALHKPICTCASFPLLSHFFACCNIPDAGHNVPDAGHNVPDAGHNVPDAGHNVPEAGQNTPATGHNAPDAGHNAPATGHYVPDAGHIIPGTGHTGTVSQCAIYWSQCSRCWSNNSRYWSHWSSNKMFQVLGTGHTAQAQFTTRGHITLKWKLLLWW